MAQGEYTQKIDTLDLIISVLKEHEKVLDEKIAQLTFLLDEQKKLHKLELVVLKELLERQ